MKKTLDTYLGIDLGTATIKVAIGQISPDNTLELLGLGEAPSLQMLKGEPQQPNIVAEQLFQAIEQALRTANLRELPPYIALGISGGYLHTRNVASSIDIPNGLSITETDTITVMQKVYDQVDPPDGSTGVVPPGEVALKTIISRNFQLANGSVLFSAIDQVSSQLTYNAFYFSLNREQYQRVISTVNDALPNQRIDFTIPAPLALSSALCPPMEPQDNVPLPLIIDLGAGVTTLSMPTSTGWLIADQIIVGTDHLANDINLTFNLNDIETARAIVKGLAAYRCTAISAQDGDSRMLTILLPKGKQVEIAASDLENVIEARLRELFTIIEAKLAESQAYDWIDQEILLAGDGALIPRLTDLARTILKRKVRIGVPYRVDARRFYDALPPRFSTLCGLLRAAHREKCIQDASDHSGNLLNRLLGNLKKVWQALFEW